MVKFKIMKIRNVNAYVLTGGMSSRMGENKAFLTFKNERFIDIIIKELSSVFENIYIVTKKEYLPLYKDYNVVCDISVKQGPIIGILTALIHSNNPYVFIKSCDNPLFSKTLIKRMVSLIKDYDIVMPYLRDGYHPLFAVYSKNCSDVIKKQIIMDNLKVIDFLKNLDVYLIKEEEVMKYDKNLISFYNINTKKDYESFLKGCI